jgi:hypothetical protein
MTSRVHVILPIEQMSNTTLQLHASQDAAIHKFICGLSCEPWNSVLPSHTSTVCDLHLHTTQGFFDLQNQVTPFSAAQNLVPISTDCLIMKQTNSNIKKLATEMFDQRLTQV